MPLRLNKKRIRDYFILVSKPRLLGVRKKYIFINVHGLKIAYYKNDDETKL